MAAQLRKGWFTRKIHEKHPKIVVNTQTHAKPPQGRIPQCSLGCNVQSSKLGSYRDSRPTFWVAEKMALHHRMPVQRENRISMLQKRLSVSRYYYRTALCGVGLLTGRYRERQRRYRFTKGYITSVSSWRSGCHTLPPYCLSRQETPYPSGQKRPGHDPMLRHTDTIRQPASSSSRSPSWQSGPLPVSQGQKER